MALLEFGCPRLYVEDATDLKTKITRIDAIIDALFTAALAAADGQDVSSYSLDDGQTKIQATARDAASIEASIRAYQRLRQNCINQLNGRGYRLVDWNSNKYL